MKGFIVQGTLLEPAIDGVQPTRRYVAAVECDTETQARQAAYTRIPPMHDLFIDSVTLAVVV